MTDSFTLTLPRFSALVPDLEAWLETADARAQVIYAAGVDAPRDSAAWALVQGWEAGGVVRLFSRRDPSDARRWQWLAQKVGVGVPGEPTDLSKPSCCECAAERAVLDAVAAAAARKAPLPSYRRLAEAALLAHPASKGRHRARYLLGRLEAKGLITIEMRKGTRFGVVKDSGKDQS